MAARQRSAEARLNRRLLALIGAVAIGGAAVLAVGTAAATSDRLGVLLLLIAAGARRTPLGQPVR